MAAAEPLIKESSSIALPGLARALISAGKLPSKTAEEIYQKSLSGRSSFIAELTGTGAVSAADLAHTLSSAFGALATQDPLRGQTTHPRPHPADPPGRVGFFEESFHVAGHFARGARAPGSRVDHFQFVRGCTCVRALSEEFAEPLTRRKGPC